MPRRVFARIGALLGLACVSVVLVSLVLAVLPGVRRHHDDAQSAREISIYLVQGPIHTDLLIPLNEQTKSRLDWLDAHGVDVSHADTQWLLIGWGARDFYTQTGSYRDLSFTTVAKAVFGDRSVLRLDLFGPIETSDLTMNVHLSEAQGSALLSFIEESFAYGNETRPLELNGYSETDMFFPAMGGFNIVQTCNQWVSRALRASGLRFGKWTQVPATVRLSHWWFHGRRGG